MLRAYPCPRLRRLVVLKGPRDLKVAYTCIRCLFAHPVALSSAERAMRCSPIPLEALPCLADPDRVHLRVLRREDDPGGY
jgi:hypothetical protein